MHAFVQPSPDAATRRRITIVVIGLTAMLAFEQIGATAAMPAVAAALDGLDRYPLAFGAMLAAAVVGMVLAGDICDRHGPRRCLQFGSALFAAGLLAAGVAGDMGGLAVGRVLQGFGSGLLGVAIYVVVARHFPDTERPRMFALLAAAWVVPALAGPALAGLLVDTLGWRSVFLGVLVLLLPVTLLMPLTPIGSTPGGPQPAADRRLWFALLAAAGALLLNLASGPAAALPRGWLLPALPIVLLAAAKLLPAGTLQGRRGLPTVVALRGLLASSFLAAEVFMPLWLTSRHGWSIAAAGIALSAGAGLWSVGSWWQSRVSTPTRRIALVRAGLWLVAGGIGLVGLTVWSDRHPGWALLGWSLAGFGIGVSFSTLSVLLLALSPADQQGANASSLQLSDALCSTLVLAGCGALFGALHAARPVLAFVAVFATAALLAALGARLSARIGS